MVRVRVRAVARVRVRVVARVRVRAVARVRVRAEWLGLGLEQWQDRHLANARCHHDDFCESCKMRLSSLYSFSFSPSSGLPSPPILPRQFSATCTCVNVTWEAPLFDGTAPILSFILDYYPTNNTTQVVSLVTSSVTMTEVCDLVQNQAYTAYLSALNAAGQTQGEAFGFLISALGMLFNLVGIYSTAALIKGTVAHTLYT